VRNHEDLEVWQRAHRLTWIFIGQLMGFRDRRYLAFAVRFEGRWGRSERILPKVVADGVTENLPVMFKSASELQNHLRLAKDLEYLETSDYSHQLKDLTATRQMLTAFLQRLRGVRLNTAGGRDSSGE